MKDYEVHLEPLCGIFHALILSTITGQSLLCQNCPNVEHDCSFFKVYAVLLCALGCPEGIIPGEGHHNMCSIFADGKPGFHDCESFIVPEKHPALMF